MRYLLTLLVWTCGASTSILLLSVGCNTYPDPSGIEIQSNSVTHSNEIPDYLTPPQFNLGDVVAVDENVKVGIIIGSLQQQVGDDYTWVYFVMFQNNTIKYTEEKLILVESFDWSRPAKKGIID